MRERPTFMPIWLACKACQHAWDDWQPVGVPLKTWAAHVRTYRCPHCGAGKGNVLLRVTAGPSPARTELDGGAP